MRMPAAEVRLHVTRDHDHRDRVEGRVGDAGRGIRQARTEVREHDAGLAGGARVAVGRVRGNLLVPRGDEPDAALAERIEQADHRVPAQPEHDFDAKPLQVVRHLVRGDARAGRGLGPFDGGLRDCGHGALAGSGCPR